jgi:L-methionine (R)-S-oxide reductase
LARQILGDQSKEKRSEKSLLELRGALKTGSTLKESFQSFVVALRKLDAKYNWVGIYLVQGGNLQLESWVGEQATEHVTIPLGQGVCGYAASSGETVNVPDVNKDHRYLMCFPSTKAELVVPIHGKSRVLGEIDIDSERAAAFTSLDERFLEEAAKILAGFLERTS